MRLSLERTRDDFEKGTLSHRRLESESEASLKAKEEDETTDSKMLPRRVSEKKIMRKERKGASGTGVVEM